ncbi:hypothetical protein ACWEQC_21925 [Streptomyces shenzhenensis]
MTDHIAPGDDETAVRTMLRRLGVRPAGHDAEQRAAPAVAEIPPMPDYPPTVTVPGPRRASVPRFPDWWDDRKPELGADDQDSDEPGEESAAVEQHDGDDQDGEPVEQPARRLRGRLRKVVTRPKADDGDEPDDLGEDDEEDPVEGDEDAGEGQPQKRSARRRRPRGEPTRPPFATAVPLYRQPEKKSLIELAREIPVHKKWLLYIGSGFAAGWYFGVPQFVREATASVAQHEGKLRDNPDVYFWGVVALAVVAFDRATRRSWFLIAWATRGLTVCLVLGALLYGNDLPN